MRRGLMVLAIVSGVICVACLSMFIRSFWIGDNLLRQHRELRERTIHQSGWMLLSSRGELLIERESAKTELAEPPGQFAILFAARNNGWQHRTYPPQSIADYFTELGGKMHFGFGYQSYSVQPPFRLPDSRDVYHESARRVIFPWVVPVMVFAILPMVVGPACARRWRRNKRVAAGFCANCGYDVRASGDQCPECGELVGPSKVRSNQSAPNR